MQVIDTQPDFANVYAGALCWTKLGPQSATDWFESRKNSLNNFE